MYHVLENARQKLKEYQETHGEQPTIDYIIRIEKMLSNLKSELKPKEVKADTMTIEAMYLAAGLSKEFVVARLCDKNWNISTAQLDEKKEFNSESFLDKAIARIIQQENNANRRRKA